MSEIYEARADAQRANLLAATTSPFTITIRFLGGLTKAQTAAFAAAADRWATVIVGDLPSVRVDDDIIDDVLILASGKKIDGPGHILGQASVTHVRPDGPEPWAFLPAKGVMSFDTDDLAMMESAGTLHDVITHEMGHVLGIGSLWAAKHLIAGAGTDNPTFTGPGAMAEYHKLHAGDDGVPVENMGQAGTRDVHWRERTFGTELMTGFVGTIPNPLSRVTVASLGDLGYQVDVDAADPYELPTPATLVSLSARIPHQEATIERVTPIELPRESLDV
jgi:leishmanolysin